MGDRVAVMRKGELQQVAEPQELYDRPVNLFVGGFIGSPAMNMVEATLERPNGDGLVATSGSQPIALDEETLAAHPALRATRARPSSSASARRTSRTPRSPPDTPADRRLRGKRHAARGARLGDHGALHDRRAPARHRGRARARGGRGRGAPSRPRGAARRRRRRWSGASAPARACARATRSRSRSTRARCTSSTPRPGLGIYEQKRRKELHDVGSARWLAVGARSCAALVAGLHGATTAARSPRRQPASRARSRSPASGRAVEQKSVPGRDRRRSTRSSRTSRSSYTSVGQQHADGARDRGRTAATRRTWPTVAQPGLVRAASRSRAS